MVKNIIILLVLSLFHTHMAIANNDTEVVQLRALTDEYIKLIGKNDGLLFNVVSGKEKDINKAISSIVSYRDEYLNNVGLQNNMFTGSMIQEIKLLSQDKIMLFKHAYLISDNQVWKGKNEDSAIILANFIDLLSMTWEKNYIAGKNRQNILSFLRNKLVSNSDPYPNDKTKSLYIYSKGKKESIVFNAAKFSFTPVSNSTIYPSNKNDVSPIFSKESEKNNNTRKTPPAEIPASQPPSNSEAPASQPPSNSEAPASQPPSNSEGTVIENTKDDVDTLGSDQDDTLGFHINLFIGKYFTYFTDDVNVDKEYESMKMINSPEVKIPFKIACSQVHEIKKKYKLSKNTALNVFFKIDNNKKIFKKIANNDYKHPSCDKNSVNYTYKTELSFDDLPVISIILFKESEKNLRKECPSDNLSECLSWLNNELDVIDINLENA